MTERELFAEALRRPDPAGRTAFLADTCPDTAVRRRVEKLLAAHAVGHPLLDRAADDLLRELTDPPEASAAEVGRRQLLPFLAPPDRPGDLGRLGRYRLHEVIGQGGFGIVARGSDDTLAREVAVKVLAPHLAASGPARKRFVQEARAAAGVRLDHVVQVFAVEADPLPHLVMEYVPGRTLQDRLDADGPLPPAEAVRVGRQVALALAAAHAAGLIHRDVKPANILLTADAPPRAKLTDFGLARATDDAGRTVSGGAAGSPLYMAPEQARGGPADHRSDLFSLGSVLYAMLAGRPPFAGPTTFAVLRRVADDRPPPLRGVPPGLAAVVERLLAKRPADRFPSAAAVAAALETSLTARPPRRGRRRAVAGGLAAVVACGAAAWLAAGRPAAGPEADAAWEVRVAAGDLDWQVREVVARMSELNPGFDSRLMQTHYDDGRVGRVRIDNSDAVTDIRPLRAFRHLRQFEAVGRGPIDLGPLRGLPLAEVQLEGATVADLSPLAGMALTKLQLWKFAGDGDRLAPLAGMPLTWLNVGASRVDHLTHLRGLPLAFLCVNITPVADLAPLAGMPLQELMCENTRVTDLRPLAGLPLESLRLNGSPVADYAPLRSLPLKHVGLDFDPAKHTDLLRAIPTLETINHRPKDDVLGPDPAALPEAEWQRYIGPLGPAEATAAVTARLVRLNPGLRPEMLDYAVTNGKVVTFHCKNADALRDVRPVAMLQELRRFEAFGHGLTDITPLADLRLDQFYTNGSPVRSIKPLAGMPLRHVILWNMADDDLSPLRGARLEFLNAGNSPVKDIRPLVGMPLTSLNLNYTRVADLTPLAGMPLTELRICRCPVTDLAPLAGLPLVRLDMEEIPAADLTPLAKLPLKHLALTYDPAKHAAVLKAIPTLETVNDRPAAEVLGPAGP
jgi:hypothetical protein